MTVRRAVIAVAIGLISGIASPAPAQPLLLPPGAGSSLADPIVPRHYDEPVPLRPALALPVPAGHSVPPLALGHSAPRICDEPADCDAGGHKCLLGVFTPSDPCFSGFISPMTNPVHFEDPRTLTEARFIFLQQNVPAAVGGGDVRLFGLQIRGALTDRLSFVAAKNGFFTSSNTLIDDGWADRSVGLKYNLYRNSERQRLLSTGLAYEFPSGTGRTLQGNGDGVFHAYLTGGTQFRDCWHWISASGFRLPANTGEESQVWYWSNHVDRYLGKGWYGLFEVNWYHWMRSGHNGINGVEGIDLWNFGSTGVAGLDLVTLAPGLKWKPTDLSEVGIAWEFPVGPRKFILQNRLTVDFIVRY